MVTATSTSVWEMLAYATANDHLWLANAVLSDNVQVFNASMNGPELPGIHPYPYRSLKDALEFVQFMITALADSRRLSERESPIQHSMELVGSCIHWRARGLGLDTFFSISPILT